MFHVLGKGNRTYVCYRVASMPLEVSPEVLSPLGRSAEGTCVTMWLPCHWRCLLESWPPWGRSAEGTYVYYCVASMPLEVSPGVLASGGSLQKEHTCVIV